MHIYGMNYNDPEGERCEECGCMIVREGTRKIHVGLKKVSEFIDGVEVILQEGYSIDELAYVCTCHEIPFYDGDLVMVEDDYLEIIKEVLDVDY